MKPTPALLLALALSLHAASAADTPPHNVILFVPDGLRGEIVDPTTAPTMAKLRDEGVSFPNAHSLFPTFTTPNASAMATGHYLGDTGDFSNRIYTGYPVPIPGAGTTLTPFLESDPVLGDVDEHFSGNYLNEATILEAARLTGHISTAIVGKLGPALILDHKERSGAATLVVDDSTGTPNGIPLSAEMQQALTAAHLPLQPPARGDNGKAGDAKTPGTLVANTAQQDYFAAVATDVILPLLQKRGQPFVFVYWSRDPDGTQHNQGDSLNALVPGINGPASLAAIRNADGNLARLLAKLKELGLDGTTDVLVSSDHGFSTISKQSQTSPAAKDHYADVPAGFLPPGFVALDIAKGLGKPLLDPDNGNQPVPAGAHPKSADGLIGDPTRPEVLVAANGGSDLVYLPTGDKRLAKRVVKILLAQDYVSGLFVDDALGRLPGTLPLSAINLKGSALTPFPAIVVNFASTSTGENPTTTGVEVADTTLQQGQGMHGSFSRADTRNFMAAIGPDFKARFVDPAPASNADVGKTMAELLHLTIPAKGHLIGRVLTEAFPGGTVPEYHASVLESEAAENQLKTVLRLQQVGETKYFDAAGFPGRSVGVPGK